jgi:hypothetical protein
MVLAAIGQDHAQHDDRAADDERSVTGSPRKITAAIGGCDRHQVSDQRRAGGLGRSDHLEERVEGSDRSEEPGRDRPSPHVAGETGQSSPTHRSGSDDVSVTPRRRTVERPCGGQAYGWRTGGRLLRRHRRRPPSIDHPTAPPQGSSDRCGPRRPAGCDPGEGHEQAGTRHARKRSPGTMKWAATIEAAGIRAMSRPASEASSVTRAIVKKIGGSAMFSTPMAPPRRQSWSRSRRPNAARIAPCRRGDPKRTSVSDTGSMPPSRASFEVMLPLAQPAWRGRSRARRSSPRHHRPPV